MDYSAAVLVSSEADKATRARLLRAACLAWPFVRAAPLPNHPAHLCMALPETSSHSDATKEALERAFAQNASLYDALPAWSRAFPTLRFSLVEVECVSGACRYGGFACQAGKVLMTVVGDAHGYMPLVEALGLRVSGSELFAPLAECG